MYLIITSYSDDPERKRIEYILEKWKEKIKVIKPEGIVAIADGSEEEIYGLAEELYAKTSKESVTLYKIEQSSIDIEQDEKKISIDVDEKRETVEKLLNFILARQKAVLKRESAEPFEKAYEVIGKKGKAEISVFLFEKNNLVSIRIRITGYGSVVDYLYTKLSEELKYFKG